MKVITLATACVALMVVPALAQQPDTTPSGRPGEVLSKADCATVWKKAGGKEIAEGEAKPYVTNFEQVDKDGNNKITKAEFEAGCNVGWVEMNGEKGATTK